MEYIVSLIQAIVWPAVVVWLGYIFRSELRALLQRLSRLKYREAEADFGHDLRKAEEKGLQIAKSIPKSNKTKRFRSEVEEKIYEQLLRIAEISPKAAFLEAWRNVELTSKEVAHDMGIIIEPRTSDYKIIEKLITKANLDDDFIKLFFLMRELRDRVAHLPDFELNQEKAERFLNTSIKLIQGFREITNKSVKKTNT